eukprot:363169-Chlamydomonas_euryale.AAC.24
MRSSTALVCGPARSHCTPWIQQRCSKGVAKGVQARLCALDALGAHYHARMLSRTRATVHSGMLSTSSRSVSWMRSCTLAALSRTAIKMLTSS